MGKIVKNVLIWIRLIFPNFFVIIGFFPFMILLSWVSSSINGFYFYKTKIYSIENAPNATKGSSNYVHVSFLDSFGEYQISSEYKTDFDVLNDVGKDIYVRIENPQKVRLSFPQEKGNGIYNSVITCNGREINNKYGLPSTTIVIFSIVGLIMFICWLKYSLIPRIRGTHPLQIALK